MMMVEVPFVYPPVTDALLGEMVQRIRAAGNPLKIVLFGSRARGEARPDSDIDLLVICPVKKQRIKMMVEMNRTLRELDQAFDILVLSARGYERDRQIPGTLARYVSKEGKILYGSTKERDIKKGKRVAEIRR